MGVIEAIFGIALMSLVFWSLFGVFRLSIEIVLNSKAKIGALALANERIEFIRSLSYNDVGTLGGIPSGNILQNEPVKLNQTNYNRRTFIQYMDDPQDGLGAADENGITADYKIAKVELSWNLRGREYSFSLVTNVVPRGMESVAGGGTISVAVLDAFGVALPGASVRIVNATTNPVIDVTTFSNANGTVMLPGAPEASEYQVLVTKSGYSTAQTYGSIAENPNPNPAHLSVLEAQTTNATFSIDEVSTLSVYTYEPIKTETFTDPFADGALLSASASTTISAGEVKLTSIAGLFESEGSITSISIEPEYLYTWNEVSWEDTVPPSTALRFTILYESTPGVFIVLPDSALPGNAAGFSTSPVDISSVSTTTYPALGLRADFSTADPLLTPALSSWMLSYEVGPVPLPDVDFALQGAKTIGSDASAQPIYKYDDTHTTGASGAVTLPNLEWDTYLLSVDDVTGFDVAESCPFQPFGLAPGSALTNVLYLVPNTTNSILVQAVDTTGIPLSGASIRLYRAAYDETIVASSCGQSFFGALTAANNYTVEVSKSGFQTATVSNVAVNDVATLTVVLTP